jgi:hypothetical protein
MEAVHKKRRYITRRTPSEIDAQVIAMAMEGDKTYNQIAELVHCENHRVRRVCNNAGIYLLNRWELAAKLKGEAYKPAGEDYRKPSRTKSEDSDGKGGCLVNDISGKYGKINPRVLAKEKEQMKDRFTERQGMTFFDGVWLKDFAAWDDVIRELNRVLVAEGKEQIAYNPAWRV